MKKKTFSLQNMLFFQINCVSYAISNRIVQRFADLGYPITVQDFEIMVFLWENDEVTHSEIAQNVSRAKATITRHIHNLVRSGLLVRKTDPHDRRVSRVCLTKLGHTLESVLIQAIIDFQEEMLLEVSPEERDITLNTLKKIMLIE